MTNYLYTINEDKEYSLDLKHTKNFELIKEELLKAVKEFTDDAYGYDTMFYFNDNYYYKSRHSSEDILKQIQEALNNNENINLKAISECNDYYLTIKMINKKISFEIIMYHPSHYFYNIETIDLNDERLENELI